MGFSLVIRLIKWYTLIIQSILALLTQGEQCACVLLEDWDISQPTLSYHRKILCRSGIVRERAVGPWKYYAIDAEACGYAQRLLQALSFGGEAIRTCYCACRI